MSSLISFDNAVINPLEAPPVNPVSDIMRQLMSRVNAPPLPPSQDPAVPMMTAFMNQGMSCYNANPNRLMTSYYASSQKETSASSEPTPPSSLIHTSQNGPQAVPPLPPCLNHLLLFPVS